MSDVTSFEVTGDWRHIVDDGMVDGDNLPDEVPLTGKVVFRPVYPTVATAGVPVTAYTLGPVTALVAGGVLTDLQGRPGVMLAGKVGEHTVRWSAETTLRFQEQKVDYPRVTFELTEDVRLTGIITQVGPSLSPIVVDPRIEALAASVESVNLAVVEAEGHASDAAEAVTLAGQEADRAIGLAGAQDEHVAGVLEDPQSATHAAFKAVGNATYVPADGTRDAPGLGLYFPEAHGAVGDGTTDDTAAVQSAIDAAVANGGGRIECRPVTYVVTTLNIEAGITIEGYGTRFLRPANMPNWTRTITNQNRYARNNPLKPIVIRGLTVDGNLANQAWSGGYELEQSSLIFLGAASTDPNIQTVVLQEVTTTGSPSDGIHIVCGIDATIRNCVGRDCFRGGITITRGGSVVKIDGYLGTGQVCGAHLEMEVDSPGYGGTFRTDLSMRDAIFNTRQPLTKPLQIHGVGGSRITLDNVEAHGGLWLSGGHNVRGTSIIRAVNCDFATYQAPDCNSIHNPFDVEFADCTFRANNPGDTVMTIRGLNVVMNVAATGPNGCHLRFTRCRWVAGNTVAGDTLLALYNNGDDVARGNRIRVSGGEFAAEFQRAINLLSGGTLTVRDGTRFASAMAIRAARAAGYDYFLTIGEIDVAPTCTTTLYLENSDAASRVEHRGTVLDETANTLGSVSGLGNNTYLGGRTIMVSAPPTTATRGLRGDVARLKSPVAGSPYEWVCTTASHSTATWKAKAALAT